MGNRKILIVEDNEAFLDECRAWLDRPGREIICTRDAKQGLRAVRHLLPEVVILDLRLPPSGDPSEGLRLLRNCMSIHPLTKVIVLTIEDRKEAALDAVRNGAEDFLIKPVDPDVLTIIVDRALRKQQLEVEVRMLRGRSGDEGQFQAMIGKTRPMLDLYELILKVAVSNANVLIFGESGTGKDLVARAIHELSQRKGNRLVTVNCAAIPENLQESELFGHERWAFTDAKERHIGAFELADQGTIFLDEIESMSLKTQAKLLRVIEEKRVRRVGGHGAKEVDFRVVSASNKDLRSLVLDGCFREDLYYRINAIHLKVPTLRERKEDIGLLAHHFFHQFSLEENKKIFGWEDDVIRLFEDYPWPGNVRELRNEVHWLVIQSENNRIISRDKVSPEIRGEAREWRETKGERLGLKGSVERFEKEIILRAIEQHRGNITRAAEELGITRQNLYFKMNKYELT